MRISRISLLWIVLLKRRLMVQNLNFLSIFLRKLDFIQEYFFQTASNSFEKTFSLELENENALIFEV